MWKQADQGRAVTFLPTAKQILNFSSGIGKCSGVDVSAAKMANVMIKALLYFQVFKTESTTSKLLWG